jgi:hypothetical protein
MVTLTDQMISFYTVDGSQLLDWIPLLDITAVNYINPADRNSVSLFANHSSTSMFTRISPPTCESLSASIHGVGHPNSDGAAAGSLEIETRAGGCNSGRRYQMRATSSDELTAWAADIRRAWDDVRHQRDAALNISPALLLFRRFRAAVAAVYHSLPYKSILIFVLAANFLILMVAAEVKPVPGSSTATAMDRVEYSFTAIFTVELLMNFFVNWFGPFIADK